MDGARRRRDALAGLTLGAVLGDEKELPLPLPPPPPRVNRTLLDIIREEEPNSRAYRSLIHHHHNKKSWKSFKDRLRIKRAGAAWSNVPASDVPIYNDLVITGPIAVTTIPASDNDRRTTLAQLSRHHSVRVAHPVEPLQFDEVQQTETGQGQVQLQNQSLSRVVSLQTDPTQEDSLHIEHVPVSDVPIMSSRSSMLRRNSSRISSPGQPDEPVRSVRLSEALAAEREQIQRVVSSTEAAGRGARQQEEEAESGNGDDETEEGGEVAGGDGEQQQQQVRMSLMDLLEETDRQMGWSYTGDGDGCHGDDDEEDEAEKEGSNLVERNCCVCMVRHKGSAFIPCGHTFCRLCSRELWVSRGNCPLCNGFILEILDIF